MREYPSHPAPVEVFLDVIGKIGRRGWCRGGPVDESNFDVMPTVSFHIHPDDADRIYAILCSFFSAYEGGSKWYLQRSMQNRFFLCPELLVKEAENEGGLNLQTANNLRQKLSEDGLKANQELLTLADALYKKFKEFDTTK